MRMPLALVVFALVAGCDGTDTKGKNGYTIALPEPELRANLAALAKCPSPLDRLNIVHKAKRVATDTPGDVTITIPSATDSAGSVLRFSLELEDKEKPDSRILVTWSYRQTKDAQELDLGEDRLLIPKSLEKELDEAVDRYVSTDANRDNINTNAQELAKVRSSACLRFGRLADGVAAVTNPELRRTLEKQKRRDALGWLFEDNYQLKTDSPEGAYWESEADYPRGYEY